MPDDPIQSSRRWLEPSDRVSEVLFGLIMVLTFTGSLSVAEAGRDDVRVMLIGALGCNIAWGIIDGVLYLMGCLAETGRNLMTYVAVRKTSDSKKARAFLAGVIPPVIAAVLKPTEFEAIHQRLQKLPEPPARAPLRKEVWLGAFAVFLWVFVTTFPVAIPFIFIADVGRAMRTSNAVAIVMLFITGAAYARCVGRSTWLVGISMVFLGSVLVAMTIALGG